MQTGLIVLDVVAKINKVNIDIRSVIKEYGIGEAELSNHELLRIAKSVGFRAKEKQINPEKLNDKYPLPAIAFLSDGSYAVLLNINIKENKLLMFMPLEKKTVPMSLENFNDLYTGQMIVLRHRMISAQVAFGFKWFFNEILKYKKIIGEVLLGSFVVQLFGLITPLFTQVILDKVIVHRSMTTLEILAIAFIAVAIFEFLLNISRNYIFVHTANKIDAKLGTKLFKHLFSLPFVYFESRKVGNIIARIRELDTIREFITNKSVSVIIDMFFSVVFVAVMLMYSVKLTLVVCGFVTAIGVLYLTITPELRRRLEKKFQMGAASNSYLVESVTGIQTVKSLAIEGSMQKKWEDHLGNYVNAGFKLANMSNISGAISGFLQKLMTISILYLGVSLVIENKLTIGQLIAFQMLSGQFTGPVLRLVNLWNELQQALLSVDRLGDILNHPIELQSANAITLPGLKGAVRFENVGFRYNPEGVNVLNQVNLEIKPGMSVGLVGRSGSGKSTMTKLLQRLYVINEGAIYIDDVDVRHMNPYWLRNNIGIVLQENFLFSGTIRENVMLSKPDASMEMVIGACQMAGAHEFISEFPEGYDTIVGERGATLSGGQRQRVAIARALITSPRILIFDEATSALDYESENIIQKNMASIRKGRTMLIIAHRLSTVQHCDLIVAMDKGQIIEMGSHEELLEKKGYYHFLFTQQVR